MRRALVASLIGLTAVLLSAGCSDEGSSEAGGAGQANDLADRAGIGADVVIEALCGAWGSEGGDQASINEYVHDLLLPLELVNGPEPPAYTTAEIDSQVAIACEEDRDETERFVESVRGGLGLSEADLDARIAAACDRYRVQQARILEGDWSGEDLASLVRDLAAGHGVELDTLRRAIDGICAPT